jgi:hypothetical protein
MLSTPGAKYMCLNIKHFCLSAPLDRFKYMWITFTLFPPWIVKQYALKDKVLNGHICIKMRRAMWGLPQAGIMANKLLKKCLAPCKQHTQPLKAQNPPYLIHAHRGQLQHEIFR